MNKSICVHVLLFASLREQAGWQERKYIFNEIKQADITPRRLWQELEMNGSLSAVRIAINQQFADADTQLQGGDEVAFLPPITGG